MPIRYNDKKPDSEKGQARVPREARLLDGRIAQLPKSAATIPVWFHKLVICNDDCDNCVLNTPEGCAKECTRFPDQVCAGCPCRASAFASKINAK